MGQQSILFGTENCRQGWQNIVYFSQEQFDAIINIGRTHNEDVVRGQQAFCDYVKEDLQRLESPGSNKSAFFNTSATEPGTNNLSLSKADRMFNHGFIILSPGV